MQSSHKLKSLQQIERQIQHYLQSLNDIKLQCEWISEYNKGDKPTDPSASSPQMPKYNKNISYYEQFWKTYLINEMIIRRANELTAKNKEMNTIVSSAEDLLKERGKLLSERQKKKKRRTSSEINKSYKCPYPECSKRYGCDVSMNLHIKLKHTGGNKTEREQLARQICESEFNGAPMPEATLVFPPGYLDSFKEEYRNRLKKQLPRAS